MNHKISEDRRTLTISVDAGERQELKDWPTERGFNTANIGSDMAMYEFFGPLIANSELEWINPADTGDLTDAPMLGILGESEPFTEEMKGTPMVIVGSNLVTLILERWAFMDYQVRSVLEDLRDKGEVVFVGGAL